jgi:hypothetical protein
MLTGGDADASRVVRCDAHGNDELRTVRTTAWLRHVLEPRLTETFRIGRITDTGIASGASAGRAPYPDRHHRDGPRSGRSSA